MRALSVLILLTLSVAGVAPPAASAAAKHRATISATVTALTASKVTTTVKVTVKARHTTSRRTVIVRVNPTGKGKTVEKQVKATWSTKVHAFRATVKVTTRTPGTVTVSSKGVKKAVKATKRPATTVKGWSTSTATVKAGGAGVRVTVKVTPAVGRTLILERRTGTSWATAKTVQLRNTKNASVALTLPAGASPRTEVWRVRVAASPVATGVVTTAKTVATTLIGQPSIGGGTGGGDTGGRNCESQVWSTNPVTEETAYGSIPGCTRSGPATVPAISTVLDRPGLDDRCGLTIVCWRAPSTEEQDLGMVTNRIWTPYPAADATAPLTLGASTTTETMFLPDMVQALNTYAVERGLISQSEIDQYGPPFRAMGTPTWTGPTATTSSGLTVVGQGGPSQQWAKTSTFGRTAAQVWALSDVEAHSQGTWVVDQLNTNYPVPGYNWTCGEQIWGLGASGTALKIVQGLPGSAGHYSGFASAVTNYIGRGYQGPNYLNTGAVRYPNGNGVVVMNFCLVDDPNTINTFHTLPGDPYAS